jgi:hypothetical protein
MFARNFAEALAHRGAFDESRDVDELDDRRDGFLRLNDVGDAIESRVGDLHDPDIRLHGTERIVLGGGAGGRERVEE